MQKEKFPFERFSYEPARYKGSSVIFIRCADQHLIRKWVRPLRQSLWSVHKSAWYVRDNISNRRLLGIPEGYFDPKILDELCAANAAALKLFVDFLVLKAYSPNTIRSYVYEFFQLLRILGGMPVDLLPPHRLSDYFIYCLEKLRLSESTVHSRMNAIKFYFAKVLKRETAFALIPRPKKPLIIPRVLSVSEIKTMLDLTPNLKHNTMLKMCYGMGLRVSEIVGLQISDINSRTMQVLIRLGKGKKDRYVNLPQSILVQLRAYYLGFRPVRFLFEGLHGGRYSIRSAQQVFHSAMKRANIDLKIGIHSLRHSFATHLLEQGTDIRFIKELLGHDDIRTTMKYTHVSPQSIRNIRSPLDRLDGPAKPPDPGDRPDFF